MDFAYHIWDSRGFAGTILMDLSKAYDCLPHNFLILKLEAYRLDYNSLTLILGHQALRKQSIKIGTSYSDWARIFWRIPQGYQENSHPENSHLENFHQSNSPLLNSPREIPPMFLNIPTRVS